MFTSHSVSRSAYRWAAPLFLILLASSQQAHADSIQMLPPVQSGTNGVCSTSANGKILTWDGASAIKCQSATAIDNAGNIGTSGSLAVGGSAAVTGNLGVGTQSPQSKLDVAGGVKVGQDGDCYSGKDGTLRYNPNTRGMEFCDGTQWKAMGGYSTCLWRDPHDWILDFDAGWMVGSPTLTNSIGPFGCRKGEVLTGLRTYHGDKGGEVASIYCCK